jgi:hypothetical protein
MAGLDPTIHVLKKKEGVDARNKCGHDGGDGYFRYSGRMHGPSSE